MNSLITAILNNYWQGTLSIKCLEKTSTKFKITGLRIKLHWCSHLLKNSRVIVKQNSSLIVYGSKFPFKRERNQFVASPTSIVERRKSTIRTADVSSKFCDKLVRTFAHMFWLKYFEQQTTHNFWHETLDSTFGWESMLGANQQVDFSNPRSWTQQSLDQDRSQKARSAGDENIFSRQKLRDWQTIVIDIIANKTCVAFSFHSFSVHLTRFKLC